DRRVLFVHGDDAEPVITFAVPACVGRARGGSVHTLAVGDARDPGVGGVVGVGEWADPPGRHSKRNPLSQCSSSPIVMAGPCRGKTRVAGGMVAIRARLSSI